MEAFPPYGQTKLQTEVTQRRAELSHEEGDSSQHGTGSPGLPCRDYPRLFRCKRQQIPHLCFRVLWTEVLPLGIERVLTIVHCLLFFLCQKIFSNYLTKVKGALPELAQMISDTGHLTQLSRGVSVISPHCHWVLELHLPCKGTLNVKVNKSVSSSAVSTSFATPWTVAMAPLSMGFSRQEYRSGWPCPSPRNLLNSGIKPSFSCIAGWFFTIWASRGGTLYATNIFH